MRVQSRDACPVYRPMMLLPKFLLLCYLRPPMHRAAALYSKPAAAPRCCPVAVININLPPSCGLCRPILLLPCCCRLRPSYSIAIVAAALLSIRCCCCLRCCTWPAQCTVSGFALLACTT